MKKLLTFLQKYQYFILLLLLLFPEIGSLLHTGLPPTHDGEYHVIRFYEFDKTLRDGSWYPRWAQDLNNGYGIPLFNYVYPFPNYAASFFHFFGFSFIDSFKLNLFIATLLGVIFFYLWTRLFFDKLGALTSAVLYAYAPYRFVDIYVRGSVGEVWALCWFPAFLWTITLFIQKKDARYVTLAGIFFSLTIFSHNILAVMFAGFGFVYLIFLTWIYKLKKKTVASTFSAFLLGIMLAAIFWLPALVEKQYVTGLQIYNTNEHFVEIYQLLIPSWGTGFSAGDIGNQMSLQIGLVNIFAVIMGFIFLVRLRKKNIQLKTLLLFFLLWFFVIVFLMLRQSKPVWEVIPLLSYFQFPWRFLSLLILVCAFIAGIVVSMTTHKKRKIILSVFFILSAILVTSSYTKPAYYHERTDDHYLSRDNFIRGTNSPGNMFQTLWLNPKLPLQKQRMSVVAGKGNIQLHESKTNALSFIMTNQTKTTVLAHIAYFPGWEVLIDGKLSPLTRTTDGRISFEVPQGKHSVLVMFNDTMIRKVAVGVSATGLITCLVILRQRRRISEFIS